MREQTIYVALLDEDVDVWRPVQSEQLPDGTFRLPERGLEDETWAFPPGSRVTCEWRRLSDEPVLVATQLAG
jgi:hypothetical protein